MIDLVAGPTWPALIDALRPGGHYAVAGAIAGPVVTADLRRVYLRDITLHGCTYQPRAVFARLMDMARAGEVRPRIHATYPLREIARAQADFADQGPCRQAGAPARRAPALTPCAASSGRKYPGGVGAEPPHETPTRGAAD